MLYSTKTINTEIRITHTINNIMEEDIGKIKKSELTDIVVRIDDFGGKKGVTIREYITSERFTGFTQKGTRIPGDKWEEFKTLINKIQL